MLQVFGPFELLPTRYQAPKVLSQTADDASHMLRPDVGTYHLPSSDDTEVLHLDRIATRASTEVAQLPCKPGKLSSGKRVRHDNGCDLTERA
jgi:hypothetical protein